MPTLLDKLTEYISIQKAKVAHHEHEGWPEHPVAVKYHQEYFSQTKIDYTSADSCFIYVPNVVSSDCENLYYDFKFRVIVNCILKDFE